MANFLRAQTTIPTASGLTENQVVWTTHWRQNLSTSRDADATYIGARILALLNYWGGSPQEGQFRHSASLVHSNAFTQVYDLMEERPRVPFATINHTSASNPTGVGQSELPPEVAWCFSYQAVRVSGVPQNRRRGRIYFGPLQVYSATAGTDWQVPNSTAVANAVTSVKAALMPTPGSNAVFSILSRMIWADLAPGEKPPPDEDGKVVFPELPGQLGAAMIYVDNAWGDNAWDTQRRRGIAPSYRAT